jgi:hypothetical protein
MAFDGAAGWSRAANLVYRAHGLLGTSFVFWPFDRGHAQYAGMASGFGVEAVGGGPGRAWTVPVEAFYFVRSSRSTRVGVRGGPRFTVAGADWPLGWTAVAAFIWRQAIGASAGFAPRDFDVEVGAHPLAGATFLGVSIGVALNNERGLRRDW